MSTYVPGNSIFTERNIPLYIRENYPLFVQFLKLYFTFLDANVGKLLAVTLTDPGSGYTTTPSVSFTILDNNPTSPTYGQQINDTKGAAAYAIVKNGTVFRVVVTSYGDGYLPEDNLQVVIGPPISGTGTTATATPFITTLIGNVTAATKQVINARDIDNSIPLFQEFLRNEFISKLPKSLYKEVDVTGNIIKEVDYTKFVKFIKGFYTQKGNEDSIKFLYRILFDTDLAFYYPKTDMLRVSDGKWQADKVIRITPTNTDIAVFTAAYTGQRIISATTKATAVIQNIVDVAIPGALCFELQLSNITGTFYPSGGESIDVYTSKFTIGEKVGVTSNLVGSLNIISGGTGYKNGDLLYTNGGGFEALVSAVDSTGAITSVNITNEGFGFTTAPTINIISNTGAGANITSNIVSYLQRPGYYIGTDGQLSSQKKIQDSYFYQDFSYQLISAESLNLYQSLLTDLVHPAGLKAFSKIDYTQAAALYSSSRLFQAVKQVMIQIIHAVTLGFTTANSVQITTIPNLSTLDPYQDQLGVRYKKLLYNKREFLPDFFTDFSGSTSSVASGVAITVVNIGIPNTPVPALGSTLPSNPNEFVGWTILLTYNGTTVVRTVTAYDGSLKNVTLDSSITPTVAGAMTFRIIQNYRVKSVNNSAKTLVLSDYDPMIDNNGTYTTISDDVYKGYKLYITSGTGAYQSVEILSYNGSTNTVTYDTAFTTVPDTTSTYYIYPAFYHTTGYYTGSLASIQTTLNGSGYTTASVNISGGLPGGGNPADPATATAVISGGKVTQINVTHNGSGYVTTPNVTISGDGTGAACYGILSNIADSPVSELYAVGNNLGVAIQMPNNYTHFQTRQRITQGNTGAGGTVQKWDRSASTIYVLRDYNSPDFDNTSITYNGVSYPIVSSSGIYNTGGKSTSVTYDSIIKVIPNS